MFIHGRTDERLALQGQIQNLHRYTVYLPWEPPFADPALYKRRVVLVPAALLGDGRVPRELLPLERPVSRQRPSGLAPGHPATGSPRGAGDLCPHLGLKIPLVDTSEENGSFEIMPCTQYGAHPEFLGRYDEVLEAGDFPNRRRLNLRGMIMTGPPPARRRGTDLFAVPVGMAGPQGALWWLERDGGAGAEVIAFLQHVTRPDGQDNIEYVAVHERLRGRGYGRRFLALARTEFSGATRACGRCGSPRPRTICRRSGSTCAWGSAAGSCCATTKHRCAPRRRDRRGGESDERSLSRRVRTPWTQT